MPSSGGTPSKTFARLAEVDIGSTPVPFKSVTLTDPIVTSSSVIFAQLDANPPTGRDLDETEMENILVLSGASSNGSFILYLRPIDGSYIEGVYRIKYLVANYSTP